MKILLIGGPKDGQRLETSPLMLRASTIETSVLTDKGFQIVSYRIMKLRDNKNHYVAVAPDVDSVFEALITKYTVYSNIDPMRVDTIEIVVKDNWPDQPRYTFQVHGRTERDSCRYLKQDGTWSPVIDHPTAFDWNTRSDAESFLKERGIPYND
jgi:hypothetical protein